MAMKLLTTATSTNEATTTFTSGIDSTYKLYMFTITNFNPATDDTELYFSGSTDGGSNYGVSSTNVSWRSYIAEASGGATLEIAGYDLHNSTSDWTLAVGMGSDADQGTSAIMWVFNPSNTTYVKHILCQANDVNQNDHHYKYKTDGYFNTTSAIDAFRFKASSGNHDAIIKLYGVS